MILPLSKLKGFLYFEESFQQITDKQYNTKGVDTIKIYRTKTIKLFFFWKKEVEDWDVYRFERNNIVKDGQKYWEQTPSCAELLSQLKDIEKGNWISIEKGSYDILKDLHPEYFV